MAAALKSSSTSTSGSRTCSRSRNSIPSSMFTKTRRAPFAVSCSLGTDPPVPRRRFCAAWTGGSVTGLRTTAQSRGQTRTVPRRAGDRPECPRGAKAAPWDTLVSPRGFLLSSTHKMDDFELRTRAQNRLPPARPLDNPAIQLHRHARRVQFQLLDETQNRLPLSGSLRLAVDRDLHHAWLTPSFSNHYSQI